MGEEQEHRTARPDDDPLVRARAGLARLREIRARLPDDGRSPYPPLEWHPDPRVRVQRGLARLREIKLGL
jgi:hypothetical protein